MPCDEQGVWIGPRSDAAPANVEDTAVALKRFEDELAEFQRLGEERWAAGDDEAVVKVRLQMFLIMVAILSDSEY